MIRTFMGLAMLMMVSATVWGGEPSEPKHPRWAPRPALAGAFEENGTVQIRMDIHDAALVNEMKLVVVNGWNTVVAVKKIVPVRMQKTVVADTEVKAFRIDGKAIEVAMLPKLLDLKNAIQCNFKIQKSLIFLHLNEEGFVILTLPAKTIFGQ